MPAPCHELPADNDRALRSPVRRHLLRQRASICRDLVSALHAYPYYYYYYYYLGETQEGEGVNAPSIPEDSRTPRTISAGTEIVSTAGR